MLVYMHDFVYEISHKISMVKYYNAILHQVFQRVLKAYATKLFARLPKGGTGIVAAATGMDGQIKVLTAFFHDY